MRAVWMILMFLVMRVAAEEPVPAKLPDGTAKVSAVLYDFEVDRDNPLIETDGKMHPGVIPGSTKQLDQHQIDKLLKALTQNHAPKDRYWCDFVPHHGVLFQARDGKILGSVSICFGCREISSKTFPKIDSPFHSRWGWAELKEIVKDAGLPIVGSNEQYTALREAAMERNADQKAVTPSAEKTDDDSRSNSHEPSR